MFSKRREEATPSSEQPGVTRKPQPPVVIKRTVQVKTVVRTVVPPSPTRPTVNAYTPRNVNAVNVSEIVQARNGSAATANGAKGKRKAVISGGGSASSKAKELLGYAANSQKKLKTSKTTSVKSTTTKTGSSTAFDGSSSLSELSSSDDEGASSSGSSDEGSYEFWHKSEGTHLVERCVAAEQDGAVDCLSAKDLVLNNLKAYKPHFVDLANPTRPPSEWAGSEVPLVELEYPGRGAKEVYPLLLPKRHNEYDPIEDILSTIRMVLDEFLTPAQSLAMFGYTPNSNAFSAFLSAPPSRDATPGTPTDSSTPSTILPPLMRSLNKARSKRDGPAFIAEIQRYNSGIRQLRDEGKIEENLRAMSGLKQKVWEKVTMQVYDRAVGPGLDELSRYEAFSDNVYGELLPKFMAEIFSRTQLGPKDVFVDLGSGVGNCVIQAAVATGCEAWGFENMAHASGLARAQVKEAEARYRMWGLASGKMQVFEADFCEHPKVGEVMQRATVVLVNNEVFTSALNDRLSLLFLDLPDSTRIVSLKAFAGHFKLTQHNRDSPLAILHQGPPLRYPQNSVSWKDQPGTFFIASIDRSILSKFDEKEQARSEKRAAKLAENRMRRTASQQSAQSRSQTPQTPQPS